MKHEQVGVKNHPLPQMSHEKNQTWLGYIGDYTTQLYWDYFINHYKDPGSLLTNQYFMESRAGFFSWLKHVCFKQLLLHGLWYWWSEWANRGLFYPEKNHPTLTIPTDPPIPGIFVSFRGTVEMSYALTILPPTIETPDPPGMTPRKRASKQVATWFLG